MQFHSLIDALKEALKQELSLIAALSSEQYRGVAEGHFRSSVGMHLRHNLDHIEAFFNGLDERRIDYETRSRRGQLEHIPEVAKEALDTYIDGLESLRSSGDVSIQVREESEDSAQERRWLTSSLGRELQFLLGHTVHHNAIIAMIVDRHGLKLPTGFGVAPSTQRHHAKSQLIES